MCQFCGVAHRGGGWQTCNPDPEPVDLWKEVPEGLLLVRRESPE